MTEVQLRAVREREAELSCLLLTWHGYGLTPAQPETIEPADVTLLNSVRSDLAALMAYVDELHGVIHDMQQDGGHNRGVVDGLRKAKYTLREMADVARSVKHVPAYVTALETATRVMASLDAGGPRLAPDDLARENAELRESLRGVVESRNYTAAGWQSRNMVPVSETALGAAQELMNRLGMAGET